MNRYNQSIINLNIYSNNIDEYDSKNKIIKSEKITGWILYSYEYNSLIYFKYSNNYYLVKTSKYIKVDKYLDSDSCFDKVINNFINIKEDEIYEYKSYRFLKEDISNKRYIKYNLDNYCLKKNIDFYLFL